jgi:hypothetical protein
MLQIEESVDYMLLDPWTLNRASREFFHVT